MTEILTIEGVYTNLSVIGDFVEKYTAQFALDTRTIHAIQMAVDEACSNIIEHGYGGEGKGNIELQFEQDDDYIKIIIKDQGAPFDPDEIPEPNIHAPLEERSEGGLGLFLIRQLMDEVKFDFGGGGKGNINTLILMKRMK